MKKIFSILFAAVLVVSLGLATAAPVLAATIRYVPSVYPTIQAAINASSDGDTIMVAAGTYAAFKLVDKNNIHIIGAEGATVTTANLIEDVPVVGDAWVMAAVYSSANINIEGINFDGTGVSGKAVAVGIVYVDSTGRIADLTVGNVIGTELGAGVAIIGDVGTSTVEMTGATISNNDDTGIYVCAGSTLEAHFNNIVDNAECGVLNDGGGTVDATQNWWGDDSGPLCLTNPFGRGNAVVGNVTFKPWLVAEPVTQTVNNGIIDAIAEADTEVVVKGTATVTIAKYSSNPHPLSGGGGTPAALDLLALDTFSELNIFSDVSVKDTTSGTELEIKLYYTAAEVEGFNETSLRIFWWNNTAWVQCSPDADSGVNTTDVTINNRHYSGYMWSKIRETGTTPSLANLKGTEFGGYGHPSTPPQGICFIATAAYGTATAKEIDILREFRDVVLLPNSLGARFVSLYYKTSPPIAHFISQHDVLRTVVRVGLVDPIVKILNWSHDLWSTGGS